MATRNRDTREIPRLGHLNEDYAGLKKDTIGVITIMEDGSLRFRPTGTKEPFFVPRNMIKFI